MVDWKGMGFGEGGWREKGGELEGMGMMSWWMGTFLTIPWH